jgi:thermostable 8-oxoguanine DNA glycosylase
MDYKELYKYAYNYLLSKDKVTDELIKKHFVPEYQKPDSINDIYKQLCTSAQNRQMSNKVIGLAIGGIDQLRTVLFDFNPQKVTKAYAKTDNLLLLETIVIKLRPKGEVRKTSRSLWPQFCQSVIDAAYFLHIFEEAKDFYKWADFFAKDLRAKPALPLMISTEIAGIGFPLACDFLKEIGFIQYGKPDVHLKEIFRELYLINPNEKNNLKTDYQVHKVIDQIAIENNVTPFEVDKLFWLIGSGNFYHAGLKIGRNRGEFIEMVKSNFYKN